MKTKVRNRKLQLPLRISSIVFISYVLYLAFVTRIFKRFMRSNSSTQLFYFYQKYSSEIELLGLIVWIILTAYVVHLFYIWQISLMHDMLLDKKVKMNRYTLPEIEEFQKKQGEVQKQLLDLKAEYKQQQIKKHDMVIYLAHDLKTPLTSVVGYYYLLKDKAIINRKQDVAYLEIIEEKLQRLEQLRMDLEQSLSASEKNPLQYSHIDVVKLIKELLRDLRLQSDPRDIQVEGEDMVALEGDQKLLQRLFENLLRNALNYGESNGILHIYCAVKKDTAYIEIKNTVYHMQEHQLPYLFEKFYRHDASRASKSGGAGLGLAIAKDIVEQHNGTIEATLANDILCMHVSLPLKQGGATHVSLL